jgi:hypothetical protein
MKTFTQMITQVGNMCESDTSAAFQTLAGQWINDKYHDVWRRYNWSDVIHNDYTFATVIRGSAQDVVCDNSTDTFTDLSHGLKQGDIIQFSATTLPTGISASTNYYLITVATNTFQVASTKGGAAVDFSTDGTTVQCTFISRPSYDLPVDFDQELNCADITDGFRLTRYNERLWWEERAAAYSGGSICVGGSSTRYYINRSELNSAGTGYGTITLDPLPGAVHTIALPYRKKIKDLISVTGTCTTDTLSKVIDSGATFITSGVEAGMRIKNTSALTYGIVLSVDSETQLSLTSDLCPGGTETYEIYTSPEIRDIEDILIYGAVSDGLLYKKQYSKAADMLQKYEYELGKRIAQENSMPNQLYQWIPGRDPYEYPSPFTGWQSYDSL